MKSIQRILAVATASSLIAVGAFAAGSTSSTDTARSSDSSGSSSTQRAPDADNTARNTQDRNDSSVTPLSQGNNKADLDVTKRIRRQIVNTKGISTDAKNVKVITANGHVTLRGPVDSADEKQLITGIAASVASPENVDSQLEVKADTTGK